MDSFEYQQMREKWGKEHLRSWKRSSENSWGTALCPIHDDSSPSLSVNVETGGFNCHGCGITGVLPELADLAGLPKSGLPEIPAKGQKLYQKPNKLGPFQKSYIYKDENGKPLRKVNRHEGKQFPQYRWDESKWKKGVGGTRAILYRLPELLHAERVCFVEGEKDADNLAQKGFPATTTPGGAKSLANVSDTELGRLAGKTVISIPDADDAGKAYSQQVCERLTKAGATVLVLTLPCGKDISEWLELEPRTSKQIEELLSTAVPCEPSTVSIVETAEQLAERPEDGYLTRQCEWDVPVPLDRPQRKPQYPIHAFPDCIRPYVLALAEAFQVPQSYAGTCVLAGASIATLKRCVLDTGIGERTHLNCYFITTMESGSGKSSCLGRVIAPIYDFERKFVDKMATAGGEPSDAGLLSSDPTCEALEKRLRANSGRYAIANAEAGDLLSIMTGRYNNGSSNFGVYLKGYSGETHQPDRVLRGATFIKNPRLAMNLAIQPASFDQFWSRPEFTERGLTARFFVDQPDSLLGFRKVSPVQIPRALKDEWTQAMGELLEINPPKDDESGELEPFSIQIRPDATRVLLAFKEHVEIGLRPGGEWDTCRQFGARAVENMTKLAGLLHCLGCPTRPWEVALTLHTMQMAIELFNYYATFSKQIFPTSSDLARQKMLEDVLDKLRQKREQWGESFKVRDLYQLTKRRSALKTIEQLRSCLTELEELGYLREFVVAKGRPSPRYFVNPAVYSEKGPQSPQPQANPYGTTVCDGDNQVPSGPQMSPNVPISSTDPPIGDHLGVFGDTWGHDGPHLEANGGKGLNTIGDFGDLFQEIDI